MITMSTPGSRKARVVIVDDSRTMQAVLEQMLTVRLGLEVVGVAGDVDSASALIARHRPDLVTIDLRLPYIGGRVLLERLATFPPMRKLVISGHGCDNRKVVATLTRLGADGCIDKAAMARDPDGFCRRVSQILARPLKACGRRDRSTGAAAGIPSTAATNALPAFPVPLDENVRLRYLAALDLANDDEDAQLDRLTTQLVRTTDFPMSLMTFIDRETVWIKSAYGYDRGSAARAEALCNHTLCARDTFIVTDAASDVRFRNHAAVTGKPHLRTYVGHPINSRSGVRLGTICLLDDRVRRIPTSAIVHLRGVCDIAAGILNARLSTLKMCA